MFELHIDASTKGLEAVLYQNVNDQKGRCIGCDVCEEIHVHCKKSRPTHWFHHFPPFLEFQTKVPNTLKPSELGQKRKG